MKSLLPDHISTNLNVAVVGAGLNGLGIAWRLARAGARVTIFDKGPAGRGASWAAAGMLAASAEAEPGEEALTELGRLSQACWPGFAREVAEASGIDPEYRDEGLIVAAFNRDELATLRFNYDYQRSLGLELDWLTPAEARDREPHLRSGLAGAVYSRNDHQANNRQLTLGLLEAARRSGVTVREHAPVEEILVEDGRAIGVRADGEIWKADCVVLAAGPWSREIPGLPEAARPPVRPIKGQMIALQMDPERPLLRHVLWAPKLYFVPRNDGRLLIGATVEERSFDDSLTAGGLYAILEAARRAVPTIEELPVVETWVGFRPGSRDDAPILGFGEVEGLVYATGHHRNGILLAPVTIDGIAAAIVTGETPEPLRAFALSRFQRAQAPESLRPMETA